MHRIDFLVCVCVVCVCECVLGLAISTESGHLPSLLSSVVLRVGVRVVIFELLESQLLLLLLMNAFCVLICRVVWYTWKLCWLEYCGGDFRVRSVCLVKRCGTNSYCNAFGSFPSLFFILSGRGRRGNGNGNFVDSIYLLLMLLLELLLMSRICCWCWRCCICWWWNTFAGCKTKANANAQNNNIDTTAECEVNNRPTFALWIDKFVKRNRNSFPGHMDFNAPNCIMWVWNVR